MLAKQVLLVAEFARIRTLEAIRLNSGESSYDFAHGFSCFKMPHSVARWGCVRLPLGFDKLRQCIRPAMVKPKAKLDFM